MESLLKKWRESLGISQACLAHAAGVNQSHVSDVENGYAALGEKLEAFLTKVGGDALELKEKQEEYMKFVKEQLEAKIKGEG